MTLRQSFPSGDGQQIMHDVTSDASNATQYSERFAVPDHASFSTQFVITEDAATYAAAITLWASDIPNPSTDDTDWVQMVNAHGFDGIPGGDPAGGDYKAMAKFGNASALWYRWKVVRSAGAGTVQAFALRKSRT